MHPTLRPWVLPRPFELGFREMATVYWLVRCFRDTGDAVANGMGAIVDFAIEHLGLVWLATVVILLFVAL